MAVDAAVELLSSFRRRGVRFAVEGEQLRYWAPAGALSPADLGNLRAFKSELISLLGESTIKRPELRRTSRAGRLLPSMEQLAWWDGICRGLCTQHYWLLLTAVVRWRGTLDTTALGRALTTLVARHEILRSRYLESEGTLTMSVDDPAPVQIEMHDLCELPVAERETAARALATTLSQRLFESLAVNLLRTHLIRLSSDDHVFVLVVHHIIADAQSMDSLRHELQQLYAAYAAGQEPTLVPPAFQYPDYTAWQHSWMTQERQSAYLTRLKNGVAEPLSFPIDPTVVTTQSSTRLIFKQSLDAELVTAIRKLARTVDATQYLIVLTALKIVLTEWTRQAQITVASVGSLRIHEGLLDMLGPFACLDLVSTDLAGVRTFREALGRVIRAYAQSQDFRPYALGSEYVSLVNVFVNYLRDFSTDQAPGECRVPAVATPVLKTEEFPLLTIADSAMPQWALLFLAKEQAGGIEVEISCSAGQFSDATVQRAFDRLQTILQACVIDADAAIGVLKFDTLQRV
jgi:hypothetical protein